MATILLIDDEKLPMNLYVRALERRGFTVVHCMSTDCIRDFLDRPPDGLGGIILDIMMLPGKAYQNKDTQQGLTTGLFVYEDIRSKFPELPVIVLTNVSNTDTLNKFKVGHALLVLQKLDYPPYELADRVLKFVSSHQKSAA